MDTSYIIPFPFKMIKCNMTPHWARYQAGWPLAPGAQVENQPWWDGTQTLMVPQIMAYDPVPPVGQWGRFAAWIDGQWIECFYCSKTLQAFGKVAYTNRGLKPDTTYGDFMCNFPEGALTFSQLIKS
jgi:hypothetical protein